MWQEQTTGTVAGVVDLDLLKNHCRVITNSDDALLLVYAGAAIKLIERDTRLALLTRSLTVDLPAYSRSIDLPRGPFVSAELVTLVGETETQVDSPAVKHDGGIPGSLSWPYIASDHDSMRLTYIAGYQSLPPDILLLVMQMTGHWYEHREAATSDAAPTEVPLGYKHMVRGLDTYQDAVR